MQTGEPLRRQAPLSLCPSDALPSYYTMKAVRDALLIHRAGVDAPRHALVLQAMASFATVGLLKLIASRLRRRTFAALAVGSFAVVGWASLPLVGWAHSTGVAILAA